jgi:hypothetical protein
MIPVCDVELFFHERAILLGSEVVAAVRLLGALDKS